MTFALMPSEKFKTNKWSGGSTTELFIFPKGSDYSQRNFDFRLSTATVDVSNSDFTSLAGVSRTLMVLDGRMNLIHQDHHEAELSKFDIDKFEGDWKTSSIGTCSDFNLMTRGQTKGDQSGLVVEKDQRISFQVNDNWNWLFVYAHAGSTRIDFNGESQVLNKGDLLAFQNLTNSSIWITGLSTTELVFCWITYS